MSPTPKKIDLKRDEKLTIAWQDGHVCTYPIALLRTMCPCALCKTVREGQDPHQLMQTVTGPDKKKGLSLAILPGNFSEPLKATGAELVGNYALRIDWSDDHGSGIYSFQYLREICPEHQHG
jgi:DUF971 family protein